MSIFSKKKPCEMFFNEKTKTFNFKGFSSSFESVTGKKLSGNLGEINYSSIPQAASERLRMQAEIHFQTCNAIHLLPKDSSKQKELLVKFAEHLMEMEKLLVSIFSDQKKSPVRKKS
ncbi:hypothetical protein [Ferruginibacter sp.]